MSSIAQFTANRANAQHSTGPKTYAGVQNCKNNATRHGLCAQQVVIKGEDPEAYDALRARLIEQWKPADEIQAMLVEQLSQNWWRLERGRAIETEMINQFGRIEAYSNKAYLALQRQLVTIERAWNRALRDLQKLHQLTAEIRQEAVRTATTTSWTPKFGSVSAKSPAGSSAAPQTTAAKAEPAAVAPVETVRAADPAV